VLGGFAHILRQKEFRSLMRQGTVSIRQIKRLLFIVFPLDGGVLPAGFILQY
jgi:hypothetical protein